MTINAVVGAAAGYQFGDPTFGPVLGLLLSQVGNVFRESLNTSATKKKK